MARKKPSSKAKASAEETSKTVEEKVDSATAVEDSEDAPNTADAASEDAPDTSGDDAPKPDDSSEEGKTEDTAEAAAGEGTPKAESDAAPDTDASEVETETAATEDETGPDAASEDSALDDNEPSESESASHHEGAPSPAADTPPSAAPEQVVIRKGGFIPMLLGGLVAAGIGFGVARYVLPEVGTPFADFQAATTQALEDQSDALSDLSTRVDTLSDSIDSPPDGLDLSGIESAQSDLEASINALADRVGGIESQLTALAAEVDDLATRPLTEGASETAVAAYERELKKLQDAIAAQRAEIEAMAADAKAMEDSAEETAQATMRRAAVTRIQTALENGSGFASALADLDTAGLSAPDALTRVAQDGVASLVDLQDSFPDAARAALAASRSEETDSGESGGFSAFLRNQLGARSLEPREGSDPDAVLSRAEAAVREGRLTDALAEIEALPEVGRSELSDWSGRAAQRLDAIAAAQTLSENLN